MMTIDQTLKRELLKTNPPGTGEQETREAPPSGADLDQHLVASSKQVLLKSIDFRPAEQDVSSQLQNLRVKYVALNPGQSEAENSKAVPNTSHSQMNGEVEVRQDGIPAPKKVLYPSEKIALAWQRCQRVGPGLINMGNTCFVNATLQCLTYTPPLTNYLLSHQHKNECRELGFCIMCELCNHVHRAFNHQQNGQALRPMIILHKLKHFAKHMHIGRQEDAHEFLRLLIEAMQKACINGFDKLDKYSKETSLVYQIFSGYYRSRVICSLCQNMSDTYEPFLDIGLDIKQVPSVTKALERLIRPEMLDGENLYQCKKCNRKVQAQKRFTIQRAPTVLTLCLKRFDFNRFSMGKINKELAYSDHLNLRPYMSDPKGPPIMYELYAVLKHEGASCNSGHYYCFVKAANQSWYCMNDAFVSQVSLQRVLNQNAYLLFYIRKHSFKSPMNGGEQPKRDVLQTKNPKPAAAISKPQSLFNGPVGVPVARPSTSTQSTQQPNPAFRPTVISGDKPKVPLQSSQPLQQQQQQQQQQRQPQQPARHNLPQLAPLPIQREKVTIQFRPKGAGVGVGTGADTGATMGKGVGTSHSQQPLLLANRQAATVSTCSPNPQSPVISGAGDATRQTQPEQSTAKATFSPLKPNPTAPPTLSSPTVPSKDSVRHMQGLVKPKTRPPQDTSNVNGICKKQGRAGLVPYTAEDSNSSSSDSDTNYDQVAAELSGTPAGNTDTQTQKVSEKVSEKLQIKTEEGQGDSSATSSKLTDTRPNSTAMKPPPAAKTVSAEGPQLSPTHPKKAGLANSANLTAIRKADSPLKLTITTNGQAQRIKATSHWRTVDSDSQVSPSPASDCSLHSNVSTNSTSEWSILDKKDAPQTPEEVKKEAAAFGWNVTPFKCKNSEKSVNDTEEQRTKVTGPKVALKFDSVQNQTPGERDFKKKVSLRQDEEKGSSNSESYAAGKSVLVDRGDTSTNAEPLRNPATSEELDDQLKLLGTPVLKAKSLERDAKEENEDGTFVKKKKKRKKQNTGSSDGSPGESNKSELSSEAGREKAETAGCVSSESHRGEMENDLDGWNASTEVHKKKKKKKKKKEKIQEEEEMEVEEEWVERIVEPQQTTEQEPLLNDSAAHSKKHKHKDKDDRDKHKPHRHRDNQFEEEIGHKHSKSHKDKKHRSKHSLMRRALEKKMKRHRDRRSSDEYREASPKHRYESHDGIHHKKSPSHKHAHSSHISHKHSKHHKEPRNRHNSDGHSSSDHSLQARLVDKDSPVNSHQETGKKKPRDSGWSSHSSDSTQTSKHSKSHKKHKHRHLDKDDKYSETKLKLNGDDESSSHWREKKKKRKHREENADDERPLLHSAQEDEDYRPEKKKKHHRSLDGEEDDIRNNEATPTFKKSRHEVPVQQWDHHIQDGYRRHSSDNKPPKTHAGWDGKQSGSGVVEELGKASLKAYGPSIKSWDGSRSALDSEVEQDSRQERQRDPYEEDFDRGKVKKVKKHREDNRHKFSSGRHNLFQSVQNMRNKLSFDKDPHGYSRFSSQSHGEHTR